MKKSFMFFAAVLLCTGMAKAAEPSNVGPILDEVILDTIAGAKPEGGERMMTSTEEQSADDQMETMAYCYAWTTCSNGRRISCYSRGDYCRWSYRSGREVYCSATTRGRTRWVRYTCPY